MCGPPKSCSLFFLLHPPLSLSLSSLWQTASVGRGPARAGSPLRARDFETTASSRDEGMEQRRRCGSGNGPIPQLPPLPPRWARRAAPTAAGPNGWMDGWGHGGSRRRVAQLLNAASQPPVAADFRSLPPPSIPSRLWWPRRPDHRREGGGRSSPLPSEEDGMRRPERWRPTCSAMVRERHRRGWPYAGKQNGIDSGAWL
jgi:hypothetical protein